MHANHREEREEIYAGDIVAGVGLKQTSTGDTLCDPAAPIKLETIEFPEPVIAVSIEPKTKADQEKLGTALARLAEEDPTFQVRTDEETGADADLRHGRAAPRGDRRPACCASSRSTPTSAGRRSPTARRCASRSRRSRGASCARPAAAASTATPSSTSSRRPARASTSSTRSRAASIPSEFIPAVEQGIEEALETGVKAGYPMVDVRVTLDRRLLPRRRLLGDGVQDRRLDGLPGGRAPGEARPAGADHGRRGRDARGVHGRRDRRPEPPPRAGSRAWSRAATRR